MLYRLNHDSWDNRITTIKLIMIRKPSIGFGESMKIFYHLFSYSSLESPVFCISPEF